MTELTNKALLVSLNISSWKATRHDKKISADVAAQHNTTTDAGRYQKALLAKGALETITKAENAARVFHRENTLPWLDDGKRILPVSNYYAYIAEMGALRGAFESAVRAFILDYPALVEDARARLNGMFNESDYPVTSRIADKFGFAFPVDPLPALDDFRVALGSEEESRIRAEYGKRADLGVNAAMSELWERVATAVGHMADRLASYTVDDATGKVTNYFRDSLVENIKELADLIPRLNLTGDANLTAIGQRMAAELAKHQPDTLRNSEKARSETRKAAEAMLADLAGYISPLEQAA